MSSLGRGCGVCALAILVLALATAAADQVELANGQRFTGRVLEETADAIRFEVQIAEGSYQRSFAVRDVRAVTVGAQRRVLASSPAPAVPAAAPAAPAAAPVGPTVAAGVRARQSTRTREQIDALIDEAGRTPPDWWDSVPLSYPQTLDLTWSPPGPQWDASRNLGQYVWSVINENPGRWREGAKLLHHTLTVNRTDPDKLRQSMEALARIYHNLLQDYARSAFWWRKSGRVSIELADCYWQLGSREMAVEVLQRLPGSNTRVIKLWADVGETERALQLALDLARRLPQAGYLTAGDVCRTAGRYEEAVQHYQRVIDAPYVQGNDKNIARARASLQAVRVYDALDLGRIADGTYRGQSVAYAGDLSVEVVVRAGRIEQVRVTRHQDKQYYSAMTDTPRQIVERQGVRDVDAVSGATITSEAILNATANALYGGVK